MLLDYDIYTLLAQVGILNCLKGLFDQQMLLFKRLVNCVLTSSCNKEEFPFNLSSRKKVQYYLVKKLSLLLGIYLLDFTNIDHMSGFQKQFILQFLPNAIKIYRSFPVLLSDWMHQWSREPQYYSHLIEEKGLSDEYEEKIRCPAYAVIIKVLFSLSVKSEAIEDAFVKLIEILGNETNSVFQEWMSDSKMANLFNAKFTNLYVNELCLVKETSTANKGNPNIEHYIFFIKLYLEILSRLSDAQKKELLSSFVSDFLRKIYSDYQTASDIVLNFYCTMFETILEVSPELVKNTLVLDVFCEDSFLSLLKLVCFQSEEAEIRTLAFFKHILESRDEQLITRYFCQNEKIESNNSLGPIADELRLKTMYISQLSPTYSEKLLSCNFKSIIEKFQTNRKFCPISKPKGYAYASSKTAPQIINTFLLTFFQNTSEMNQLLCSLILNLLMFSDFKVNLLCETQGNNGSNEMKLILDFLYEAYYYYHLIILDLKERKYQTMDSVPSSDCERSYLIPSEDFLKQLSFTHTVGCNDPIDSKALTENMQIFYDFFHNLYYCHKVNKILLR